MDYIQYLINFIETFKTLKLSELKFEAGKYLFYVKRENEKIIVEITEK